MNRTILVGTALGAVAQNVREKAELVRTALQWPALAGTLSNDAIASHLLARLCKPGGVFIDVGAHIGSVIDGVRRHGAASSIIAVEAIPEKAEALGRKFPDVAIHACALGEESGVVHFYIDVRHSGYSSLYPHRKDVTELREIEVPLHRLDDLVPTGMADVIKIDVEGAELGVLRGGAALIARAQPVVMFESGAADAGYSKAEMWDWFAAADYALLVPNRVAHEDDGLGREGFIEAHLFPPRTNNYFAVPRQRRIEIRDRARVILGL